MKTKPPSTNAGANESVLLSHDELLQFVDEMALARASALARAGDFLAACRILIADPTLPERSPKACDLFARIYFRLGDRDTARRWWVEADRLSGGAEPYRSTLATFRDYARWQKHRRHLFICSLVWHKTRRGARTLVARVVNGFISLFK